MLPSTSYITFRAIREKGAQEIWRAHGIGDYAVDLCHFTSLPSGFKCGPGSEIREFRAERYGGKGVGRNGGGSRCGNFGSFQVKGIGLNPMVGRSTDSEHMTGTSNLGECLIEAMWSQICDSALPFGSVQSLAIVTPNSRSVKTQEQSSQLGRMLRPITIRPAHFMRATQFDPEDDQLYFSDSIRTKLALMKLQSIGARFYPELSNASTPEFFLGFFQRLASRFAEQIAASRIKRIPHGSLNCSNICLDGKFIDFGTMTSTIDYRPVVTSFGAPDTWNDETGLAHCLSNLFFYVNRYVPNSTHLISLPNILRFFDASLLEALKCRYISLFGFPSKFLELLPRDLKSELWNSVHDLQCQLISMPVFFLPNQVTEVPNYNINCIAKLSAFSRSIEENEERIYSQIPDLRLRRNFLLIYWKVRELYFNDYASCKESAALYLTLNCCRMNADLSFVRRYRSGSLDFGDTANKVHTSLANLVDGAQFLLHEPQGDAIVLKPNRLWVTPTGTLAAVGSALDQVIEYCLFARGFTEEERTQIYTSCNLVR